jgi:hypothetical protein
LGDICASGTFTERLYHKTAGSAGAFTGDETKSGVSNRELRQQIENLDIVTNAQYSELYRALIELTSQKKLAEEKPRKRIGFKPGNV